MAQTSDNCTVPSLIRSYSVCSNTGSHKAVISVCIQLWMFVSICQFVLSVWN